MVPQDPTLFSTTIAENIAYAKPEATLKEIEAVAKLCYVDEFVSRFPDQYQTVVGERGIPLSGGQKQRVSLARAYLNVPRILILDEATSSLDAESEFEVQKALRLLMKGRTTLVIAHRLASVRESDLVLVMDRGQVVERGTHEELIRNTEGLCYRRVQRQLIGG